MAKSTTEKSFSTQEVTGTQIGIAVFVVFLVIGLIGFLLYEFVIKDNGNTTGEGGNGGGGGGGGTTPTDPPVERYCTTKTQNLCGTRLWESCSCSINNSISTPMTATFDFINMGNLGSVWVGNPPNIGDPVVQLEMTPTVTYQIMTDMFQTLYLSTPLVANMSRKPLGIFYKENITENKIFTAVSTGQVEDPSFMNCEKLFYPDPSGGQVTTSETMYAMRMEDLFFGNYDPVSTTCAPTNCNLISVDGQEEMCYTKVFPDCLPDLTFSSGGSGMIVTQAFADAVGNDAISIIVGSRQLPDLKPDTPYEDIVGYTKVWIDSSRIEYPAEWAAPNDVPYVFIRKDYPGAVSLGLQARSSAELREGFNWNQMQTTNGQTECMLGMHTYDLKNSGYTGGEICPATT